MLNRIDWAAIDPLIKQHLPSMTCVEFGAKYNLRPGTVANRGRLLGIRPAPKTISAEQRAIISTAVKARKVWRIDWAKYDNLIEAELPKMTIAEFGRTYAPDISTKQISKRAKKLGITPKKPAIDAEHRKKLSDSATKYDFTQEQDEFMRLHADDMGQKEIAQALGVSQMAIWRRMNELGIHKDKAVLNAYLKAHLRKILPLSIRSHRQNLSNMTPEERRAHRQRCSDVAVQAMKEGKIKPGRGIGQECITVKGGTFKTRSSYETRYMQQLEDDPKVIKFIYEPFSLEYEHDDILKHYTPDFLVLRRDRVELIEVKPSRMVTMGRNPAKFRTARRYCIESGYDFVVVTEVELKK